MDSETKEPEEKPGQQKIVPAVSEEVIVRPAYGDNIMVVRRGSNGKFKKKERTMPKTADVTRMLRQLMLQPVYDARGKATSDGRTRIRKMFDNMVEIATASPFRPVLDKFGHALMDSHGDPVLYYDAKAAMSSVTAFKELELRVHGQPAKSEEELEAQKASGVKVLIIHQTPPDMMDKTLHEDKPREALKPAFIEAEMVGMRNCQVCGMPKVHQAEAYDVCMECRNK